MGSEPHVEMSQSSERNVGQYRQRLVQNLNLRKARQEGFEKDLKFDSSEIMSDAVMQSGTKGHRGRNIRASQIQPFGGGEDLGIVVCGQYPQKHDISLFYLPTPELEVLGSDPRLRG